MANVTGEQSAIQYCPVCKAKVSNIPRDQMTSSGYVSKKTGRVAEETHTYMCNEDKTHRFEINQAR
jgi:hypothetical protein